MLDGLEDWLDIPKIATYDPPIVLDFISPYDLVLFICRKDRSQLTLYIG